uniref:Ribosomal protein L27A n=1 Tax=Mus musculus TaxID=10090 RepID=G3UZV5_MOUSE
MVGLLLASAPSRRVGALLPSLSAACYGPSGSPWLGVACGAG